MAVRITSKVSIGKGDINFTTSHVAKVASTQLFIKFKTTESQLLDELLHKFKNEKFMDVGTNPNNKVDAMTVNNNCVFAVLPEAKIMSFIQVLHKYLLVGKISSISVKNCLNKSQSYKRLHDDIKSGYDCIVTGKCKNFTLKLHNNHPSIKAFGSKIAAIESKDMPDIVIKKASEPYYKSFDCHGSDMAKLYFAIFCSQFEFIFKGTKIITDDHTYESMKWHIKEYGGVAQGFIKSFLNQCGKKLTKPAANDTGGSKMKEKNEIALYNLNVMIRIICEMFGLGVKTLTMASWELDKTALAEMKKII